MKTFCSACKAEIVWLKHVRTGKPAPIDADPDPDGNVIPSFDDQQYRIATSSDQPYERYANHFQTCPQAKSFKRSS